MADVDDLRRLVATSCRVVGTELGPGAGHVSARISGTNEMWLRCRGGRTVGGLAQTDLHHIRRLDFDGGGPGLGKSHFAPHETPLHGELYKARPEVGAVVHVHPKYALLCSVTGVEFTPIFGGYNPGLARIAILGVPTYHRAATIIDPDMAAEMIEVMGDRNVVLLRGHGIAATGPTVQAATSVALRFENLCEIMWQVALTGRKPIEIARVDKDRYDPRKEQVVFPASRDWQGMRRGEGAGDGEEGGMGWRGWVQRVERSVGLPSEQLDEDG